MVHPPGGKTAPHSIKAPRFEPLGQIVSPFGCNSFLSLLLVYALQACPSVGGGTAGRPCAGQKFSAQELLSIPSCARLHKERGRYNRTVRPSKECQSCRSEREKSHSSASRW